MSHNINCIFLSPKRVFYMCYTRRINERYEPSTSDSLPALPLILPSFFIYFFNSLILTSSVNIYWEHTTLSMGADKRQIRYRTCFLIPFKIILPGGGSVG